MLIAMSGMDCAGKSTQIEMLTDWARQHGYSPRVLWYRPGYSPLLNGLRAAIRRAAPRSIPKAGDRGGRKQALSRPWMRRAWVTAALVDTALHYAVVVRSHLWRGRLVVCDRHLEDAKIDLALDFPESARWTAAGISVIRALAPKPGHAFLLTLPVDEVSRRSAEKDEPFPDDPDTRQARNARYVELARKDADATIDGLARREDIHARIVGTLEEADANL